MGDILEAIRALREHLLRGDLNNDLVSDAVRMRIVGIGEAVKDVDPDLLAAEPEVHWQGVARMRDRLAHHYFDTSHAIAQVTINEDLPVLGAAVRRITFP